MDEIQGRCEWRVTYPLRLYHRHHNSLPSQYRTNRRRAHPRDDPLSHRLPPAKGQCSARASLPPDHGNHQPRLPTSHPHLSPTRQPAHERRTRFPASPQQSSSEPPQSVATLRRTGYPDQGRPLLPLVSSTQRSSKTTYHRRPPEAFPRGKMVRQSRFCPLALSPGEDTTRRARLAEGIRANHHTSHPAIGRID